MSTSETPRLESTRLILDRFCTDDLEALFAYASQPEVARWMAWEAHRNLEDTRAALDYLTASVSGQFEWAMRLRPGHQLIGGFTLTKKDDKAEIHFTVSPSYWGSGYATEAGRRVLAWAWEEFPELAEIHTAPAAANLASRKVLERLGFSQGCSRVSGFHKFPGGIEVVEYRLRQPMIDKAPPTRLAIFGNAGSGKSYLAAAIGAAWSLPRLDLDTVFWMPGGFSQKRSHESVRATIMQHKLEDRWIIEGVYDELVALVLDRADGLIWLDLDWATCFQSLQARRRDSAVQHNQGSEQSFRALIDYAQAYWTRQGPRSFAAQNRLFSEFPLQKRCFHTRGEIDGFISSLKRSPRRTHA